MSAATIDIDQLSAIERLDLIGRLWDSLDPKQVELSSAQRQELDRRLDALDEDVAEGRDLGTPWEDIRSSWKRERSSR